MRYVNNEHMPKRADLRRIEAVKLRFAAMTAPQRAAFLKKKGNHKVWTRLRLALWSLGGCKCWYSEALLQAGEGHVEHYRPKGTIDGESHSGYWWRAFDWRNYRLSHPTVNLRVTDYLSGKLAGKGACFPLKPGCERATCQEEEHREKPVLLDPTNPADCELLCFDTSSGVPQPRYSKGSHPWLHRRAARSIEFYYLDEPTWTAMRMDLIAVVNAICTEVETSKLGLERTRAKYETAMSKLARCLDHGSPFSSLAEQVARERGLR